MTTRKRQGVTYTFSPVGLDAWERRPHQPPPGTKVRLTKPNRSLPPQGTMGHYFVEDAETGRFYGLVLGASLTTGKGA